MSSTEAPVSPQGKPNPGFWGSTAVAILLLGVIGGIGAAIVAWRKGYRTAAKWLSIASVVWTAIVVALVVLLLSHGPGPSAGQLQSWLASHYNVSGVTCNMPGSWTPGNTFECFANHESFKLTVLRSQGNEFRWYVQPNG
ncbi:MAG TPA: hypothetical protein VNI34_05470 [Candidatus Nitrosotalea sp.]|nr:hypothetical protein [Candidatus Nitrosotalea sp.]